MKKMMGIKIIKLGQDIPKKKLSVPLAGQSRKRSRGEKETRPGGQCSRDREREGSHRNQGGDAGERGGRG